MGRPLRKRQMKAGERTRTADPFITNEVLYQLSYAGASAQCNEGGRAGRVRGVTPAGPALGLGLLGLGELVTDPAHG